MSWYSNDNDDNEGNQSYRVDFTDSRGDKLDEIQEEDPKKSAYNVV